jgi:hypothetical protein
MSWTRIGTVSVTNNSNAVVGAGTAFLTNSRIGDAFLGPDGVLYEVINVGSDTAISISPNYKGVTNASAAYALIPVQGYPKVLADAFNTINNQFGATFAALGPSGTAAGIKTALGLDTTNGIGEGSNNLYFTQARALATPLTGLSVAVNAAVVATDSVLTGLGKLQAQVTAANTAISGKAAKGANSDITSLSGLTTVLTIAQGGTGRSDGLAWGGMKGTLSAQTDLQSALDAKSALGIGQTWQNMLPSRALGTTYTNTSGKPIQVAVLAGPTNGINNTVVSTVNGVGISSTYSGVANQYISSSVVVVPAGATYSITINASITVIGWVELR